MWRQRKKKMKKLKLIVIALLLSINSFSQAPGWAWAKSVGGNSFDSALSVTTDAVGNVYVTGFFGSPTLVFGATILTHAGGGDMYLAKYDASGNVLWAKSAGGIGNDEGLSVTTDTSGYIYVTGRFSSPTIVFGATTLTNSGGGDIYLVKYDASGNVLWAKSAGGNSNEMGNSIVTEASGNVYVAGYFSSPTLVFGSTTLTNAGLSDMYLVKYDASGNVLWAKSAGGNKEDIGSSVTSDGSGNVFVTGRFESPTLVFGATTLTNAGLSDMYLVKYDASGNVLWAKSPGGQSYNNGHSVTSDASGNVYVTGDFGGTLVFGTTTLSTGAGGGDMYLAKYDASGNVLWAKKAGGNLDDFGYSIATDVSGNVYVTGVFFSATLVFGNTTLTNAGFRDIYLVKYDASGNVLWAKSAGGTDNDYGASIATDASGSVYVAGYFFSPTLVFGITTLTNAGTGTFDLFIAKLNTVTGISEIFSNPLFDMYPNPASRDLHIINKELIYKFEVFDLAGQLQFSTTKSVIDVSNLQPGIYFVKAFSSKGVVSQKFIKE